MGDSPGYPNLLVFYEVRATVFLFGVKSRIDGVDEILS